MEHIEQLQPVSDIRQRKQRRYPRVHIELPVTLVRADDGVVLHATATDVSPGGFRIRCDRGAAYALNPSGRQRVPDDVSRLYATFTLPLTHGGEHVTVTCQLVYFRILPDTSEIVFGTRFLEPEAESYARLYRFLEEAMLPA